MSSALSKMEVHPEVDVPSLCALIRPGQWYWNAADLRRLTFRTSLLLQTELLDVVRYVPEKRWWSRLALTGGVELWLLSWLPGQGTDPHDHGGASGSFTVLGGTLTEDFRTQAGANSTSRTQSGVDTASRSAGQTVAFGPHYAHRVRNDSAEPAASVHAYSPPLLPTREVAFP